MSRMPIALVLCLTVLGLAAVAVSAQDSPNVTLSLVEERYIGTDCPAASALSSDGNLLWVLMHDCGHEDHYLISFGVGGGRFSTRSSGGNDYASALSGLDGMYIDGLLYSPLSVTASGSPQLQFVNADSQLQTLRPAEGSSVTHQATTEQILSTTEYPETAVFSPDQSAVAVVGTDGVIVLDTASGQEVLAISVEAPETVQVQFTADGEGIELIVPNNPERLDATTGTLYRYALESGELLAEQSVLSTFAWPSPDGRYIVLWLGEDELVVTEPATGGISGVIHMDEEPRLVTECVNEDGFDPSETGFTWTGYLPLMGLNWLPDSSGFLTINSYNGSGGASDNSICLFSESRLRRYAVGHEG